MESQSNMREKRGLKKNKQVSEDRKPGAYYEQGT